MATKEASLKDNNFFASSSTQNDQYSNLNLNSNIQKTVESVQSKDIPIDNGRKSIDDKCDDNFSQSKNTINLEQINKKSSNALDYLAFYESETEEDKKKVEEKNSAKSTVSLHIAAYENEAENSNLTELSSKNVNVSDKTKKLSVNPKCKVPFEFFEFSRQQENDVSKPEIMQFRASQRLLNPNERGNPQGIKWKEPQMQKLLDDFIDGKLPMNVEQFANHVNQISNTNTSLMTIRNRINDRQKERRLALQANSAATTTALAAPSSTPPAVQNVEAPIASRMDLPPPPASNDDNDDTVTYKQLYRAYLNFWNSLNNCVDDEYKIIPENGTRPTYREAKNLWKAMKHPRRRKLLWVATGFLHDEFPNDEAEFRREEEAGLINETNVTTGADAELESSSDDDDDIDIDFPDMDDENIPPVITGAPQNALDRLYGGRPAEIQDISSDEEPPQDPINANAVNDLGLSLSVTLRPETPLAILEASHGGDPDMSPVHAEIGSTGNAAAALALPAVVATVPPVATPSVADQLAAAEVGNEVVEDSQMDECVDAFVETVQDDYFIEEPDLSPPRSPVHDSSQISALSDSPIPTPQSSYPNSQIPNSTVPKGVSPPKKRRIIETDDESDEEMKDFKPENDLTSYIDEQIALPEQNQAHKSKPTKKIGRKKPSPKPTTLKPTPRGRTRSAIQADKRARKTITPRRRINELDSDDSEDSVQSNNSVLGILDSDIVSDDSDLDFETSSLDGFIEPDDSVSEEESSDESITMSDSQRTVNSEDPSTQSTLNDDIYTRNDSVERDLPATVPRATVKNTPTTPKITPLFAHLGKSRYSSDAPATTPRRPTASSLSSKCGTFNQRRTTQAPVAQSRGISTSSSRGFKAAGPVRQTRAKSVERATTTPAPTRQRQRSGDAYMQPAATTAPTRQRQRTGESFIPYGSRLVEESRQSRAKSIERNEAPGPSRQRQRSGETSRQLRGKSAERTDAIPAPSKRQSRGKSAERTVAIPTPSKRQSRGPSIQPRGPSIDSRRSTSSARFGSATRFVDDDSDSSRPSSKNSIISSLPDGYEEINKNNKRAINGILYIIHEINGKKYYRRYKPCGSMGVFNSLACHDFYCVKCRINQKDTLVKTMVKSNRIFAETNHVPDCELKEYNIED